MDARQRYDAKRPLLSFRLPRDDVDRFDAWRLGQAQPLTRAAGLERLVSEALRNGHEPDMEPAPIDTIVP